MGGSSGGSTKRTLRHAPYLEHAHHEFLDVMRAQRNIAIAASPYADYTFEPIEEDFFGVGYLISNFPSLYDMFGKFMAGFDVDGMWNKAVASILSPEEVQENIQEQVKLIDDRIILHDLPEYQHQMRDANAVVSSSYVIGAAMMEDERVKSISKLSLEAMTALIPKAEEKWINSLNWNQKVIKRYALTMRDYFSVRIATDDMQYGMAHKNLVWPLDVLDYEARGLAAFDPKTPQAEVSEKPFAQTTLGRTVTIVSWTVTGAYIGSEILPGWGTLIGGVIGFIIGLADAFILNA